MPALNLTCWSDLRQALTDHLDPSGQHGFEGLMARLLAAETGKPFYLARSGDQPTGDAYSPMAGVSIQAKLYKKSKVAGSAVEADIQRVLRECPLTDVYILATTKADSQLKLRLEKLTEETGVDLLLLVLDGTMIPLGALCVKHWGILKQFLPELMASADE
ncbi:hypothetical protein DES53_102411 [Roseimicrobium gellanilyticum]|uniref:Restriction endonuclease n=1 Tax=Roseimicrobium gellanilyticum TaxID=748857 RepID=A0A366HQU2_9BACT|nr:hypothetical protein [Roseimicrobium gellanilyticum]RBP46025.1 hypothetical protein DES53_102411 [Roseimicrobium gellanilyticum]